MSDRIQNNKLVALHIRILDESGKLLETTEGFLPMLYVHGHRQIPPGFEQALAGKTVGDKIDVQVPAEFGYGLRDEDLLQTVPRSLLATDTELAIGMEITAETADGPLPVRIVELNEHSITLDGNHAYAGKTLRFVAEIRNVRDATEEELTGGPQT